MKYLKLATMISATILSTFLQAGIEEGKVLFKEADCMRCHKTVDFKHREDKINSYLILSRSVKACARNSAAPWFDEDDESVTEYLNKKYYHYKK